MKKIKLLLFAAAAFTGMQVKAQTVDEIVNKYIEAMGGKEKLAALKTIKMEASVNTPAGEIPITITKSHMIGTRTDFEYNGTGYYQVANAKKGQMLNPGSTDPVDMDADTYKYYETQMDIQGALFNYKEKGHTVELLGTEKVEKAEAYKLKVTYKNGVVANYYIDKTTNRIIKTSGKQQMRGEEMDVETVLSDYKQNADGYWFPYTATSSINGPITFSKIETNIQVDEKIFAN